MAGGGAPGAVGRWGGGRRVYRGRGEVGWREESLQGPWEVGVAGGEPPGAVGSRGNCKSCAITFTAESKVY